MSVITVLGEMDVEKLGIISPHEHILIDIGNTRELPNIEEITKRDLFYQKVSMPILGNIMIDVFSVLDNLILSDVNLAIKEVLEFKKFGGNTIIDQTCIGIGRDPVALKNISCITGLNIITCTGFYHSIYHPEYVKKQNEDELAKRMIKEITEGIGNTRIRAGVIGEIGTSPEILQDEIKVLKAAAMALIETGVVLFVHTWPFEENGIQVLDILEKMNVNLNKVVICHVDGKINLEYYKEMVNRGAYIEMEMWGRRYGQYYKNDYLVAPNDWDIIGAIEQLINLNNSYINKILLSTDICTKVGLIEYGGNGYSHILKTVIPLMKMRGFSEKQISTIVVKNPKILLSN